MLIEQVLTKMVNCELNLTLRARVEGILLTQDKLLAGSIFRSKILPGREYHVIKLIR